MKLKFILFFLLGIVLQTIPAQQWNYNLAPKDSSNCYLKNTLKEDSNYFIDDLFNEVSKPLDFDTNDWIKVGAIAGLTGFFITQDQSIKDFANKNHSRPTSDILKAGELYGSVNSFSFVPFGFYLTGLVFKNEEIRTTGRVLFESLLASGMLVQTLKIVFGRARPYMNKGAESFYPIRTYNDFNSFPSGHTVVAFTISSVLARRFDNTYASIGLYTLAGLTAYQRVYSNNHWFSDTFLSAAIGIVVGNSIMDIHEKRNELSGKKTFSLNPVINSNFTGINFAINF